MSFIHKSWQKIRLVAFLGIVSCGVASATPLTFIDLGAESSPVLVQVMNENQDRLTGLDFSPARAAGLSMDGVVANCRIQFATPQKTEESVQSDDNKVLCDYTANGGAKANVTWSLKEGAITGYEENGATYYSLHGKSATQLHQVLRRSLQRYPKHPLLRLTSLIFYEHWESILVTESETNAPAIGCTDLNGDSICLLIGAKKEPAFPVPAKRLEFYASLFQNDEDSYLTSIAVGAENTPVYRKATLKVPGERPVDLFLTGAGTVHRDYTFEIALGSRRTLPVTTKFPIYTIKSYLDLPNGFDRGRPIMEQVAAANYKVLQLTMNSSVTAKEVFLGSQDTLLKNGIFSTPLSHVPLFKLVKNTSVPSTPGTLITFIGYGPKDNETVVIESTSLKETYLGSGANLARDFWTMWFGAHMLDKNFDELKVKLIGPLVTKPQ